MRRLRVDLEIVTVIDGYIQTDLTPEQFAALPREARYDLLNKSFENSFASGLTDKLSDFSQRMLSVYEVAPDGDILSDDVHINEERQ